MSAFLPGDRVRVTRGEPWWSGREGTVVEMREGLLNGHDCAVLLDGAERANCWYDRELIEAPHSDGSDR